MATEPNAEAGYHYCTVCDDSPFQFLARALAEKDAALAEARLACKALLSACDELMTEFVSKKRAADWGVINDAMVAGGRALFARAPK